MHRSSWLLVRFGGLLSQEMQILNNSNYILYFITHVSSLVSLPATLWKNIYFKKKRMKLPERVHVIYSHSACQQVILLQEPDGSNSQSSAFYWDLSLWSLLCYDVQSCGGYWFMWEVHISSRGSGENRWEDCSWRVFKILCWTSWVHSLSWTHLAFPEGRYSFGGNNAPVQQDVLECVSFWTGS